MNFAKATPVSRVDALLVASRVDGEGACSKTLSTAGDALYGRGSLSRRAHRSSAGASAEEVEGARKKDSTRQIYPSLHQLLGRKSPGMALGRRWSWSGRARARRRRERLRWVRWEQHDLYAIDFTGEEQVWGVWLMHLVV